MRTANGSADRSADSTEQDRSTDPRPRMFVLADRGSEGSSEAKADKCTDQCVPPVSWLPPHSAKAPRPRISEIARSGSDESMSGNH
jgi:hypothetical protein